jgi:hypothetical protein
LQKVGEFQCADISALCTDFPLEIGNYALQVCGPEAGAQELIPEPFAIEAQTKSLSSPGAVKLVEFVRGIPSLALAKSSIAAGSKQGRSIPTWRN